MPPNTVYVGRPSKWGNPFKILPWSDSEPKGFLYYRCVNRTILDPWIIYDHTGLYDEKDLIYFYEMWITGKLTDEIGLPEVPDIYELKGKDLCCWCPLDQPCHADVIIKLLNQ
jgi:hypothetical protein